MKEIKLTQGKVAFVDDEDFEYLNQFKWHAVKNRNTFHAKRNKSIKHNKPRELLYMHREIINAPKNLMVDHRDHNGLNNQRSNLRLCNNSQNHMNRTPWGRSKYLGVSFHYRNTKIRATILNYHLGYFDTEEKAAHAYDLKAKELFGEFANLNFK